MNINAFKAILKQELPNLLREDPTLRVYMLDLTRNEYADRIETQDKFNQILEELRQDREVQERKWEDQNHKWEAQERKWEDQNHKWEEQSRKWEAQGSKWQEYAEAQERKWNEYIEAQDRKWDEYVASQDQKWKEYTEIQDRKWDEYIASQDNKWTEYTKAQDRKWDEYIASQDRKWEEQNRKWDAFQAETKEEFKHVHELIMAQAKKHERSIGALGSRWGLQSERAFRNALAGILEANFGVQVLNVNEYDDSGTVFGRPDQVELDIIIKNGLLLICELKSSIDKAGMYIFERKARFYEKRHQRTANRLIVISPMIDQRAKKVAVALGIETYSDSLDIESIEDN